MVKTTTQETTLKIIKMLRQEGLFVWRQNNIPAFDVKLKSYRKMPRGSIKGVPDIIGFTENGIFVAVEIKATGKLSDPQKYFLDTATKSNCIVFVVKDFDDFVQQWQDLKNK